MLDETSIGQRLTTLEKEVAMLKQKSADSWLDTLIGSIPDEDAFLQALEYGRAYRDADKPSDEKTRTEMLRGYNLLMETLQGFSKAIVLPFDAPAIALFEQFQAQKIRGSTMDLRIAAIALSRDLIVLTRNTRDFSKVPRLQIEDWTI